MPRATLAFLLAVLPSGRLAAWQCPDGAPPPCARPAPAARPAPPDPDRIAVFPFRITTADTLLGEGLAELLSNEFIGPTGPRPVLMGTVLRAWRRAGGGLRAALSQGDAARVATELGAGLYVDGSVVGLGSRMTISGSVITVPGGEVRRVAPVSGGADSLPALVERFAAGLLATAGTSRVAGGSSRITDSPDAMRLYLEAMADFRRGHFDKAATGFERAFAADSLFARAAYMRWLVAGWGPGFGTAVPVLWRDRTRALRDRLSPQDQLVLEAALGGLAVRERIAAANPDLPEVWYYIGDVYYHNARARGWSQSMARARDAFERSLALDSQATVLHHMVEIGMYQPDTALLRSAWNAYDRLAPGDDGFGLAVAARLNDARLAETMRRRLVRDEPSYYLAYLPAFLPASGMPAAQMDEIVARAVTMVPAAELPALRAFSVLAASNQGRPAAAERAARQGPMRDTVLIRGFNADVWLMVSAALGDGDRAAGDAARARVLAARYADSTDLAVARCGTRLWDALVSGTVSFEDDSLMAHFGQPACATLLRVLDAQRAGTLDSATLRQLDSAITQRVLWGYSGVGPLLLARAWESLGNRSRALVHLRGGSVGFPDFSVAPRRRAEARLAAQQGDTAGAIRVYREYLDLRRDAEPALIPQRDSVQAELNRLLGRGRAVP